MIAPEAEPRCLNPAKRLVDLTPMEPSERIQIRVSDDRLEAWASIAAGPAVQNDTLVKERLEQASIRAGLDLVAIEGLCRALEQPGAMLHERRVACGRPPEPGSPPVLHLDEPIGLQPGTLARDGSLDLRERRLLVPVARDECLGRIEPAREGKPGWDVHGDAIEPAPSPADPIRTGEGIALDVSGRLIATRSGTRTIAPDGMVDVVDHHVHAAPVDLRSGHLTTAGSLEVKRDVMADMRVEAGFDLLIAGTVDGGCIRAGGSIEIRGGALGREAGSVRAAGDLEVRHALGIRLEAGGRLRVARSVSTSQLIAREIEVAGRMLGEWLQAESRVVVKDAGSPAGAPCLLRAAHPLEPRGPSSPSGGATSLKSTRPEAHRAPGTLRARKGRGVARLRHPTTTYDATEELAARRLWRRRQRELQRIATIEIRGTAYAGCRIDLGVQAFVLEADVSKRRYRIDRITGCVLEEEL